MATIASLIESWAARLGVPQALAVQVGRQESGLDNSKIGGKGEIGIFQLMPSTAAQLGVNPSTVDGNVQGGVSYLAQLYQMFGDWGTALTAYNWGLGNVQRYGAGAAPASTKSYVAQAMGASGLASGSSGGAASAGSGPVIDVTPVVIPDDASLPAVAPAPMPVAGPNYLVLAIAAVGVYLAADLFLRD